MTSPRIRVIKVGGSLLECQALPELLRHWLRESDSLPAATCHSTRPIDILIAGGGTLVDHVREFDQRFDVDPETAHWMSVGAMNCTARLLASRLDLAQPVHDWGELLTLARGREAPPTVFDVEQWLVEREASQAGVRLSLDWRTTSDSIAGRLSRVLRADLVLLKSTDKPPEMDWREAANAGLVDEFFPQVAAELSHIDWVNLRRREAPAMPELRSLDDTADSG